MATFNIIFGGMIAVLVMMVIVLVWRAYRLADDVHQIQRKIDDLTSQNTRLKVQNEKISRSAKKDLRKTVRLGE